MQQEHTFVIPAYKQSPYLETCIQSLQAQKLPTKILIATSTPSDYLKKIAEKYHIPYFISHSIPGSIGADWNFAIEKATTRYITIAHQDDIYNPAYTQEVLSKIEEHLQKKPLIAFTHYIDIINKEEKNNTVNAYIKNAILLPFHLKKCIQSRFIKKFVLSLGNPICCPAVTIDTHITNHLKFLPSLTCVLDWEAWLQLADKDGAFIFINKKLVKHRIHIDSETTNQIKIGNRRKEETEILQSIWGKKIGSLIARIYTSGYKGNAV